MGRSSWANAGFNGVNKLFSGLKYGIFLGRRKCSKQQPTV